MRVQRLLSCVKKSSLLAFLFAASPAGFAQDIVITGVVDGPLTDIQGNLIKIVTGEKVGTLIC